MSVPPSSFPSARAAADGRVPVAAATATADSGRISARHWLVIIASSTGTVFEWYDFYIYASLATFFGELFFPKGNPVAANLASLAIFGAGFGVRPLGALVFGVLGDRLGRKNTFLITISLMGLSTALVGVLPTFAQIGLWAPVALTTLRLLQGLALGGEYGGAATYVVEHAPAQRRGFYGSWVNTTASLGFFLSLLVILAVRSRVPEADFKAWGWRIPFLVSLLLLAISVYIRFQLQESPAYQEIKAAGTRSKAPLAETFGRGRNLRLMFFGLAASAGMTVTFYVTQFYAYNFLVGLLKVDFRLASTALVIAIALATPVFVLCGRLSDQLGRKPVILAGLALGSLLTFPLFHGITAVAHPALAQAMKSAPVTVYTSEYQGPGAAAVNTFQDIFGNYQPPAELKPSVDARAYLLKKGVPFNVTYAKPDQPLVTQVGDRQIAGFDPKAYDDALTAARYPAKADPGQVNFWALTGLIFLGVCLVCLSYGPLAAFLVELFPTRIRYTSLSVPYNLATGWFGGFLPLIAASIVVFTGNIYSGLWYSVLVSAAAFAACLFAPETRDRPLNLAD